VPIILAALLILVAVVFLAVVLIPIALIQRYRTGTMRRRARGWLATVNVVGVCLSIVFVLISAAITNVWIPQALGYAAGGVIAGLVIGVLGLALTRWETFPSALFYTPNRWLVLAITIAVAGRIGFGFWRTYQAWHALGGDVVAAASTGVAGSLGAGALILGYYAAYWLGVRRRTMKLEP
jgi:hypothetical protein